MLNAGQTRKFSAEFTAKAALEALSGELTVSGLARSTWPHRPKGEKVKNLDLTRRIDTHFLKTPFYGSRQMQRHFNNHLGMIRKIVEEDLA